MGFLSQLLLISLIGVTLSQSCIPSNWNYAWVKVGKAWFTQLKVSRTWLQQVEMCKKVEPAHMSTIGTLRNKEENSKIQTTFTGPTWIGGFEVGSTGQWFWWGANINKITTTFWASGEPSDSSGPNEGCMMYGYRPGRSWDDDMCSALYMGLCEFRCD
ncbi:type-2 ice-structuring protein-like [Clytia hemisphaerica]|uniref:C-type lectin domain-containing protein n=1 Tax=Clytia hemisphaerica TaxID=252671 RepID=A0A7M5UXE0_9CNID